VNITRPQINLKQVKVLPLAERRSLCPVEKVLIDPSSPAPACPAETLDKITACAHDIRLARHKQAAVILLYGAHLLRNGAALILEKLMAAGWLTHVATNGAGSIHDWEFAWLGRSTESVKENVAQGTFGTWDETGRYLHLALLTGSLQTEGYGTSVGRFIMEDGTSLPEPALLENAIRTEPAHPLAPARAELLVAMREHRLSPGRLIVNHKWKHASILAQAFRHGIPATVHPGIGYDIIATHPMFNGAVIGRAAGIDFARFVQSVEALDGGVVLSIGSAIMAPQVFEKSLSCVNNLRRQQNRLSVQGHSFYVVDLQDGGQWDWTQGEPPKTNPAYYLRFCKSYSRMGGVMQYLCCDNVAFIHHLYHQLMHS
jgi:hypothetical protein